MKKTAMKWREVRPGETDRSVEIERVMGGFVGDEWLVIVAGLLGSK